jgi:predicted AlkP superfamily phosphohydrolase/phosphomutase
MSSKNLSRLTFSRVGREAISVKTYRRRSMCLAVLSVLIPNLAFAYVGPGAGFAFLGSAFVFILTLCMAVLTIAFWPLQWAYRRLSGKRISKHARTKRVVVLGLDGLEPKLVDRFMQEGLLPNMKALAAEGSYERLSTTLPPLSPVAWSTFQTGVNPGAHNIFDFLTRDKRFCLPLLSSTLTAVGEKEWKIGPLRFKRPNASIQLLRKSQPFWKILGRYGVFSNVIRVPISYPPEKFEGNILSAMCTPDLKGTQGSFCAYTTKVTGGHATGGKFQSVKRSGRIFEGQIEGPPDPKSKTGQPLVVPFKVEAGDNNDSALLRVGSNTEQLKLNQFSNWLEIEFSLGARKSVSAIVRFCLRQLEPDFFLYMSPLNINPERPALPISHPVFFSTWLAKRQGPFGTLGLMEDTWGRNEKALDDQRFLDQTYLTHEERKEMFFAALDRTRQGVCACVFDASDRIQHMFWRYLDPQHPSPRENASFERVIPEMYQKMDELVGQTRAKVNPGDVLIVLSDHGFTSFRRCVNINTWLLKEGYLALKDNSAGPKDYLQDVEWSKTKAFGIGLTGIYLNQIGRERNGIVKPEEAAALKREIIAKLEALQDPSNGQKAVRRVYDSLKVYKGAYASEAPDLIVGTEPGYRVSWESVTGGFSQEIFEDNLKAWSGDHDVAPDAVPGVFFCNRPLTQDKPAIIDLAPTILDLFKVPVPTYMEGRVLL